MKQLGTLAAAATVVALAVVKAVRQLASPVVVGW